MAQGEAFILGEFRCKLDDRYRVRIPPELAATLTAKSSRCVLAKERLGCVSLWSDDAWRAKQMDAKVQLIEQKLRLSGLQDRIGQVQLLGRLLSTRHRQVELDGQHRFVIPPSFREFLGAETGKELLVVGAGVCVELWSPTAWLDYLGSRMPRFQRLFERLST
jgi:MraZ protein